MAVPGCIGGGAPFSRFSATQTSISFHGIILTRVFRRLA